ncbi:MAG: aminoacyl-tRNA deacylase [Gemmatimonadota bacterium]
MIAERLKALLDEESVDYEVIEHTPAYTAMEEAAAAHVPGRNWAKTVVVRVNDEPALAVLPATRRLDLEAFRRAVGSERVELADESEFRSLYPDCEPGAMPPFGNLYGQRTFVDESLREDEYIAFHAGDHRTAVEIPYSAFERLVNPVPEKFSRPVDS